MENIKPRQTSSEGANHEQIKTSDEWISHVLEQSGIKFRKIDFPENTTYTKAFILDQGNNYGQDTVRIYRGIDNTETIFNQEPYINRFKKYKDLAPEQKAVINESLQKLTQNPTKQNLDEHIQLIMPYLNDREKAELAEDMKFVLDGVSDGFSVRRMIHQKQVAHPLGASTFGVSPYLSFTYQKSQVYAGNAILIIDAPIFCIEDWSADEDAETNYVGQLNNGHIAAIVLKKEYDPFVYQRPPKEESLSTLELLEKSLPVISQESMKTSRKLRHQALLMNDTNTR